MPHTEQQEPTSSAPACRRYEGKVALVTASSEGIGLSIARRLAHEGASVVICSRRQANVDAALRALRSEGLGEARVSGTVCHVGKPEDLRRLVDFCVQRHGRIDVVVSNAAVNPAVGPVLELEDSVIDKLWEINVASAIKLLRLAVPHMRRGGAVVIVSSYAAFSPAAPIALYGVTKTALVGLTKALADELGPQGVRVNCVAPGVVPTKFASALVESSEAEALHTGRTALGRLGRPDDMAAAAAYLGSGDAAYVTGETLVVAGGMQSRL